MVGTQEEPPNEVTRLLIRNLSTYPIKVSKKPDKFIHKDQETNYLINKIMDPSPQILYT